MRLTLLTTMVAIALSGAPSIQLKASPLIAQAGIPVMVNVTIQPRDDLRSATIEYTFGSSTWQIDPSKGVERRSFVFKLPEPGEHQIRLTTHDSMSRVLASQIVTVTRVEP